MPTRQPLWPLVSVSRTHAAFLVLNCVGLMPAGPCNSLSSLALLRGNISLPQVHLPPTKDQALSPKGQQPAENQYAEACAQVHNEVHASKPKLICCTVTLKTVCFWGVFQSDVTEAFLLSCDAVFCLILRKELSKEFFFNFYKVFRNFKKENAKK